MDNLSDRSPGMSASEVFPPLQTARLLIRRLQLADQAALFRYRSLPEGGRYQNWRPVHIQEAEAFIRKHALESRLEANTWLQLGVCLPDGQLIGDLGIHVLEDTAQVEIAYTFDPAWQGRGYAQEAVRALLARLFNEWRLHRVIASVDPDNRRSIHLLERIGFRREAHFIKSFRIGDEWCDDLIYALLDNEWAARQAAAAASRLPDMKEEQMTE